MKCDLCGDNLTEEGGSFHFTDWVEPSNHNNDRITYHMAEDFDSGIYCFDCILTLEIHYDNIGVSRPWINLYESKETFLVLENG